MKRPWREYEPDRSTHLTFQEALAANASFENTMGEAPVVTEAEEREMHAAFDRFAWTVGTRYMHPVDEDTGFPLCAPKRPHYTRRAWRFVDVETIPIGWKYVCKLCGVVFRGGPWNFDVDDADDLEDYEPPDDFKPPGFRSI